MVDIKSKISLVLVSLYDIPPTSENFINFNTNHIYDERKVQSNSHLAFDFD